MAPIALAASAFLALASGAFLVHGMLASPPSDYSRFTPAERARAALTPSEWSGLRTGFAEVLGDFWRGRSASDGAVQEVDTPAGEMVAVEPGFGVLEIVVDHDADVWIDGGPRGVVQGSGLFTLPTGDHDVEIRSGDESESRSVDVADGEAVRLDLGAEG